MNKCTIEIVNDLFPKDICFVLNKYLNCRLIYCDDCTKVILCTGCPKLTHPQRSFITFNNLNSVVNASGFYCWSCLKGKDQSHLLKYIKR